MKPKAPPSSSRFLPVLFFASILAAGCGRAPHDEPTRAAGSGLSATATDATDAPSWPAESAWMPLMKDGVVLHDVVKDRSGESDVVGDATRPSVYVHSDGTHL